MFKEGSTSRFSCLVATTLLTIIIVLFSGTTVTPAMCVSIEAMEGGENGRSDHHQQQQSGLGSSSSSCSAVIDSHYPKQYVAYKSNTPPVLDGDLNEPFWEEVPFSDRFVDISTTTAPWLHTRMKIRYDDEWLYVGGHIQDPHVWANITHTCHCFDPHEDQVIFHDNDFEVFVDADASCHYYKEYEMNAANQSWDLCLNVPYENGGYENSSRVFGKKGFDMVPPLRSAAKVLGDGAVLNDPASKPTGWSVEIAFPLKKLAYNTTATVPPKSKDFWRINFSRVEYKVKIVNNTYIKDPACQSCPDPGAPVCDNWVWSPMHAIDMHHPEMWGILQFSDEAPGTTSPLYYQTWSLRYTAHELFYANYFYGQKHGWNYTDDFGELLKYVRYPSVISGDCTLRPTIQLSADGKHYTATILPKNNATHPFYITIDDTRLVLQHDIK